MAQAMTKLVHLLQDGLQGGPLKELSPFLELVGSMAEGTRIGLANELDIHLHFKTWIAEAPFKVEGDPFSLKRANRSTGLEQQFFVGEVFQWHRFMHFLLEAVNKEIEKIFEEGRNPPGLRRVTTNKDWIKGKTPCNEECKRSLEDNNFEQCARCAVAVCKTKSGVALQFEYKGHNGTNDKTIYCSIDLIPFFPVEPIKNMDRVRLINEGMVARWL